MTNIFERFARHILPRIGPRLVAWFGPGRVASWMRNYGAVFNTAGNALLWPDAPWFNTYDPGEEEDCVLDPANTAKPRDYYGSRGWLPWWVVATIRTQEATASLVRWLRCPRIRRHASRPAGIRDPGGFAED